MIRPSIARSLLFICDIQDRFRPLIHNYETVIRNSRFLMDCSKDLGIPILVTEQNSKVLGQTVSELGVRTVGDMAEISKVFEKKLFSMMTPEVTTELQSSGRSQVILVGIESHVCVLQTCLDLIQKNVEVIVVADAVSSQRVYNRTVALQRMQKEGALITTSESLVFELLGCADHPSFKAISGRVKALNALGPDLFSSKTDL